MKDNSWSRNDRQEDRGGGVVSSLGRGEGIATPPIEFTWTSFCSEGTLLGIGSNGCQNEHRIGNCHTPKGKPLGENLESKHDSLSSHVPFESFWVSLLHLPSFPAEILLDNMSLS